MSLTINNVQRPNSLAFKQNIDPNLLKSGDYVFITRRPGTLESGFGILLKNHTLSDEFVAKVIGTKLDWLDIDIVGSKKHQIGASISGFWNKMCTFELVKVSEKYLKAARSAKK